MLKNRWPKTNLQPSLEPRGTINAKEGPSHGIGVKSASKKDGEGAHANAMLLLLLASYCTHADAPCTAHAFWELPPACIRRSHLGPQKGFRRVSL